MIPVAGVEGRGWYYMIDGLCIIWWSPKWSMAMIIVHRILGFQHGHLRSYTFLPETCMCTPTRMSLQHFLTIDNELSSRTTLAGLRMLGHLGSPH